MVLDELHELIETLQARIASHAPALQQSEALTRYALVDPLLRGLGWDTGDPNQVIPEYRSAAGSADYALFGQSNKPQVIIEAKKLGTQLDFKVRQQVTGYCQEEGIPYAVITDGRRWELYDVFKPVAMKDSIVVEIDLEGPTAKTSLDALALWRPGVASRNIKTGAAPVVDQRGPTTEPSEPPDSTPYSSDEKQWHQLSTFSPGSGTAPRTVRLPDETEAETRGWGDFIAEIGRWLYENGHLKASLLPIQRSQHSYVVAIEPVNPNGKRFSASRQIGPFYANVNLTSVAIVRNARTMIQQTNQDPADFAVRLQ